VKNGLNILFITQYFPPEVGAAQTRICELATRLQQMGHCVSVLTTFPSYPSGVVPKEWRGKAFWRGSEGALRVYRVWSYPAPNRGFLKRIVSQATFALASAIGGLFIPACDAIIVESPPLFDGFPGLFLSLCKRAPYLFNVSDLWPESAVQMGALRNRFLIWVSKRIELLFYRRAAAVLAMTAGIRDKITADGITPSRVMLLRNSVNCELFHPGVDGSSLRREIGLPERGFIVLYAGTFGMAQGLTTVLESAALLQESKNQEIYFVLAGDGAEVDLLKAKARALNLSNVRFVAPLPKMRIPELLSLAGCIVVPLRKLELFRGALPTKMFEAMACAKPVILGIEGEAEALLREAQAGCCVAPENSGALGDAILRLMADEKGRQRMGQNGRDYVTRHFSPQARVKQLSELLEAAPRRPRIRSQRTVLDERS
jgi:glycosyltransferase involved in cell wall biosynthesis